jgi:hypothetical protein
MPRISISKQSWIIITALAVIIIAAPTIVSAKESTESPSTTSGKDRVRTPETVKTETETETETQSESESSTDDTTMGTTVKENREQRREVAREKLDDKKKEICNKREAQINTVMDRVTNRSQEHINRITAVADKTKSFYIAQGNVLDTYDSLVAAVDAARVTAQAAVDSLVTTATFSCESDGPKSDIQTFRNERLGKIEAVKAYRTAVKALIAGVKSVQPEPTVTSEVQQ